MLTIYRFLYKHTIHFPAINEWIWQRKTTAFLKTCGKQSTHGW